MATSKTFQQYFEDFEGVDRTRSHLTRSPKAAIVMNNLEMAENQSLVGRQGRKVTGQPLYIKQIHTYSYVDEDGVTHDQIIGIGGENENPSVHYSGDLFRLVENVTLDITYAAGSTSWDYSMLRGNSSNFTFTISQGGSTYFTTNLGNGLDPNDGADTIKDLVDDINATSNFTAVCPKTAVVNGLQTVDLSVATLTVDSGHTLSVGDWVFITASNGEKTWFEVMATTATTITFHAINTLSVTFADNTVIGVGALKAASLIDLHVADEDTTSSKSVALSYWEMVPSIYHVNGLSDSDPPFKDICGDGAAESTTFKPPSLVNHRNCCYMTANWVKELEWSHQIEPISNTLNIQKYQTGVWKYDGKDFGLSFVPRLDSAEGGITSLTGTGTGLTGTFRYKVSIAHIDYQGNEIEVFYESFAVITVSNQSVSIVIPVPNYSNTNDNYFNLRGAASSTTGVSATVHTVPARHSLRTGHKVYVKDTTTGLSGIYPVTRTVTAYTNTSVTLDSVVTVPATAGLGGIGNYKINIWRTKANGSDYFLLSGIVVDPVATSVTITDGRADSTLGIPITAVAPEYIQVGLSRGNALASHQDCLVVGGGARLPKKLMWDDPAYPECSDQAVRLETMPFSRSGDINSIATDTGSTLMVFGPSSQFALRGSIADVQYEIEKSSDTGKGVAGPQCVALGEESLFALGKQGLTRISYGIHDENFGYEQLPLFLNTLPRDFVTDNVRYNFAAAQTFYEDIRHRVHYFIPVINNSNGQIDVLYTKYIIWDYINDIWYDFSFSTNNEMYPSAGFAIKEDTLYTCGWSLSSGDPYSTLMKTLYNETSDPANDYYDNCLSYTWELSPQWDDAGLPKINKTWHELVMYMLQPDLFVAAFTVLIQTYRNWSDSPVSSTRSLTFSSATDTEQECKFNADSKAKRFRVKMTGTVAGNPPVITGYEYTRSSTHFTPDRMAE